MHWLFPKREDFIQDVEYSLHRNFVLIWNSNSSLWLSDSTISISYIIELSQSVFGILYSVFTVNSGFLSRPFNINRMLWSKVSNKPAIWWGSPTFIMSLQKRPITFLIPPWGLLKSIFNCKFYGCTFSSCKFYRQFKKFLTSAQVLDAKITCGIIIVLRDPGKTKSAISSKNDVPMAFINTIDKEFLIRIEIGLYI